MMGVTLKGPPCYVVQEMLAYTIEMRKALWRMSYDPAPNPMRGPYIAKIEQFEAQLKEMLG